MVFLPRRIVQALSVALVVGACASGGSGRVRVIIPRGASFRAASDSLAKAGLVRWPRAFRAFARVTGNDREIKAGTYLLDRGTSWGNLVKALTGGAGIVSTITI